MNQVPKRFVSNSTLDLYIGGARFESSGTPGALFFFFVRVWFSLAPLGKCQDSTITRPHLLSSISIPIHYSYCHLMLYSLNTDSIIKRQPVNQSEPGFSQIQNLKKKCVYKAGGIFTTPISYCYLHIQIFAKVANSDLYRIKYNIKGNNCSLKYSWVFNISSN